MVTVFEVGALAHCFHGLLLERHADLHRESGDLLACVGKVERKQGSLDLDDATMPTEGFGNQLEVLVAVHALADGLTLGTATDERERDRTSVVDCDAGRKAKLKAPVGRVRTFGMRQGRDVLFGEAIARDVDRHLEEERNELSTMGGAHVRE